MKPAVKLKLNGKPLCLKVTVPSVAAIMNFLNKQAPDELFTSDVLAKGANVSQNTIKSMGHAEELNGYSIRSGKLRYWGNPKAIAALKEQLEAGQ
jgi:hypothetical protein